MRIVFCFIFLFNVCYCIEDSKSSATYVNSDYVNYGNYGGDYRGDYQGDYRDDYRGDNRDDGEYDYKEQEDYKDSIVRPCSLRDTNCIRRFFAQNSRCTPTLGSVPDPVKLKNLNMPVPHANFTVTMDTYTIIGLNDWDIKEFFMNKATGNLVLEVEFKNITIPSQSTITFHLRGKEPVKATDFTIIEYEGISLTLTIPHFKNMQLSRGHVYSYIPDVLPKFSFGPSFLDIKDPEAQRSFATAIANLSISLREVYVTQGPLFLYIFLQSAICNFGY